MYRKWMLRLLCIVLAPALFLAALESLLRAMDIGFPTAFLLRNQISGRAAWVDNQFFGYRFFPPRMTRMPAPIAAQDPKPDGIVRIVLLGESAAMGEPLLEFGSARQLGALLAERFPGRRFEVVNAAMTAINSHFIREIARDAQRLKPDLYIIYMGNNEVVGPYGPGTILADYHGSAAITRLRVLATRLRTAGLLRRVVQDRWQADLRWPGMGMFMDRKVAHDDPRLERVYDQFDANLEAIICTARRAGADVLLTTIAVNLRDAPPFAGDDTFSRARAAEAAGQPDAARRLYREARDRDQLRFRADSRINRIIRTAAARHPRGVQLADAEAHFEKLNAEGIADRDLFLDHVHFTFAGNYELARLWLDAIAGRADLQALDAGRALTIDECADRLLFTDWNRLDLTDMMIMRRRNPPFSAQEGNRERLTQLTHDKIDLFQSVSTADLGALQSRYEQAMERAPEDWDYPGNWGEILLNVGRFAEAERWLRRQSELLPHRLNVRGGLALVLGYLGRSDEGVALLTRDAKRNGHYPADLLLTTSKTLFKDRRYAEALPFAEAAFRLAPRLADAALERAEVLFALGRFDQAEQAFKELLRRQPESLAAASDLAALYVRQGRLDQADATFRDFLARNPDSSDARVKHIEFLLYRGNLADAQQALDQLLRDHPTLARARYLQGQRHAVIGDWEKAASALEEALRLDDDAKTAYDLARVYATLRRDAEARALFARAAEQAPDQPAFAHALAWLLATHPEQTIRDPDLAVQWAERASLLTRFRDARTEDTRAAAYAAAGRFDDALQAAAQARRLALDSGDEDLAARIRNRIAFYQDRQPYVEKVRLPVGGALK